MADLPKTLRKFAAYVDGVGYVGKVVAGTPPKLTLKTEEFIDGAMVAPVDISTGQTEKLVFVLTMKEMAPDLYKHFGQADKGFTLRGAQGFGADAEAVIYQMRGLLTELDSGEWKPGGETQLKLSFTARYLKLSIAGTELIEIDAINTIFKVGGVDQLAADRAALGI